MNPYHSSHVYMLNLPEENPYSAAQKFLARNDLSPEYLDQVVSFIEKNSGGVKVESSQEFVDPYTGELGVSL